MKKLFLLAFGVAVILIGRLVFAQEYSSSKETVKVKGNVVGVDIWTPAGNLSFAPQQQIFVVRKAKMLKGKEAADYLKVIYQYQGESEPSLNDLLSGNNKMWSFKLKRNVICDSSLEEMKFANSVSLDGKEKRKLLRLKDLGGLSEIIPSKILPCYLLENGGFKRVK